MTTSTGLARAYGEPSSTGTASSRGILAPIASLDRWLHVVLIVLILTCAARYGLRHGLDADGVLILGGAAVLAGVYALRPLTRSSVARACLWVGAVTVLWAVLTILAPSFAWTAVPIAFAAMQVLPFGYSVPVVVIMTLVVAVASLRIAPDFDPTLIVGPIGIALVTVISFRALQRGTLARQRLLDELSATQADLLLSQRRTGALAERARLSREIHDSVGQRLTSINLHLQAAERAWEARPRISQSYVEVAALTAREGLDDVRRIVADLAPAALEDGEGSLVDAIERVVESTGTALSIDVHVHGNPVPVEPRTAAAVIRTVQGALGNVIEHSAAARAAVTLTYDDDQVIVDVRDDGRGFDRRHMGSRGDRGHGLTGIERRASSLGGWASIESAPGDGTTVSVGFPNGPFVSSKVDDS